MHPRPQGARRQRQRHRRRDASHRRSVGADHAARRSSVDGRVTLAPSLIGGVQIARRRRRGPLRRRGRRHHAAAGQGPGRDARRVGPAGARPHARRRISSTTSMRPTSPSSDGSPASRGLEGSLVLDGTVTGNAASLETTGTLNGNGLAYGEDKALDSSKVLRRHCSRPGFRERAECRRRATATFVEIARHSRSTR